MWNTETKAKARDAGAVHPADEAQNGKTYALGYSAARPSGADASPTDAACAAPPARIRCLYEGADQRLCLFETADGHLISVNAARLV
ncbi:hypothetical protein [Adlercreutzia murintestinalis]|jgi:hypothetical protein|uniref:hypothetical protein n=1 Tax=Adlercreutzia murintestinalis TaxID=2941325 RepID=UPI00203EBB49|nr:hypothetical protein [Adlercreutzia murintestinalis]